MLGVLYALLAGDGLLATLSSSGISLRSLSAYGQTSTMPKAAITLNLAKTSNILLNLPPKRAFNSVILIQMVGDAAHFIFGQVTGPNLRIDSQLVTDIDRENATNTKEVGQRNIRWLIVWDVHTKNTRHRSSLQLTKQS